MEIGATICKTGRRRFVASPCSRTLNAFAPSEGGPETRALTAKFYPPWF